MDAITTINQMIEEMMRIERELTEKTLARCLEENDFIVNSPIEKMIVEKALPGAHVCISQHVEPGLIIMVRKAIFDIGFDPLIEINKEDKNDSNNLPCKS